MCKQMLLYIWDVYVGVYTFNIFGANIPKVVHEKYTHIESR